MSNTLDRALSVFATESQLNSDVSNINSELEEKPIFRETISELESIPRGSLEDGDVCIVGDSLRGGVFKFSSSNMGSEVSSDPQQGVYVAPSNVPGGGNGAWERQYQGPIMAEWFGSSPWSIGDGHNSNTGFQAAADFAGWGGEWRWSGRHRITTTINIPNKQTFGSFGQMTSVSAELFDPNNYQGVHTSPFSQADKIDNAVFYDAGGGAAFVCGESAQPRDFLLYGGFYFGQAGTSVLPYRGEGQWYDITGIQHGKYIRPSRVSVLGCRRAYYSVDTGGVQGDYYTTLTDCEIIWCHTAFAVSSTDTYNTKLINCRINSARFGEFNQGVRDFRVFGGSFESFNQQTNLVSRTNLSFNGTYFETFDSGFNGYVFRSNGDSGQSLSFRDCLIYMNYVGTLAGDVSTGGNHFSLNSTGNTFVLGGSSPQATVYRFNDFVPRGTAIGDQIITYGATNGITYAVGATVTNMLYHAPVVS